MSEGVGVFITYFFVWLSQGQQYETGICLALNWIGLQLESFVLKYVKPNLTETGYNTLCGTFCGLNFLLFVLFNSIAVVGLQTAQVFSVKLLQQGKGRFRPKVLKRFLRRVPDLMVLKHIQICTDNECRDRPLNSQNPDIRPSWFVLST